MKDLLRVGANRRVLNAVNLQKQRGRTNSIIAVNVLVKECDTMGNEVIRNGRLNLVDLAGSEVTAKCVARDEKQTGAEFMGPNRISQSLLTLGRVITALIENKSHVPYRESKLTRLTQEALGGRGKTCMIATYSASVHALEETCATLDYANRVRSVKNTPAPSAKLGKL